MLLFIWGPAYVLLGHNLAALTGWITLLNALMGITWAFISTASTLFLVRLVGRSNRGRALGLYNAVSGAGGLLGTLLGGWFYAYYGVQTAYLLAAATVVIGTAMLAPIPYHMFALPHGTSRRRQWRASRATSPGPSMARREPPAPPAVRQL
jgi:MFS family permease